MDSSDFHSSKEFHVLYTEQKQYWSKFHRELDFLREKYGASVSELAEGLGISRQRLYNFLNTPEQGLPLARYQIKTLWSYLTSPSIYRKRKLSPEIRQMRSTLGKEDLNSLLMAVGFLPDEI